MNTLASHWIITILAAAMIVGGAARAYAEENAWKLPNLNPFASKAQPPTASRAPSAGGNSWGLPRLWPKTSAAKRSTGQPSTMQKMTKGTKQFFSKTADVLNPWDDENDQPAPRASGSNSAISRATTKKKKESSGSGLLPASWWSSDEENTRDKTVNDFLARPRPGQK